MSNIKQVLLSSFKIIFSLAVVYFSIPLAANFMTWFMGDGHYIKYHEGWKVFRELFSGFRSEKHQPPVYYFIALWANFAAFLLMGAYFSFIYWLLGIFFDRNRIK